MSRLGQGPRYFLSLLEPFILGVLLHLDKYFEMLSTELASSGAHMVYHEEVAAGDMYRVTLVSSALLWPSEHGIVAWSGDAQTNWGGWPLMCSDCFPRPESKNRSYVFTIYNPSNSCKKQRAKKLAAAEKKIMSHHAPFVNTELKSRCSDLDPFPGGAGFSHALLIGGIGLTFPDQRR